MHNKSHPTTVSNTQLPTTPQTINSQPQPTQNHSPPQSAQNQITHNHPNRNLPSYYLYKALLSDDKFHAMSDAKSIEQICMILTVYKEEIQQANINIKSPHNWHNVTTEIVNKFNNSYIMRQHQHG
jgi:hypothetical protein